MRVRAMASPPASRHTKSNVSSGLRPTVSGNVARRLGEKDEK